MTFDNETPGTDAGANNGANPAAEGERLQKVMAAAGVASRRVSEDLIAKGRVTVNGEVVTEPGRRVHPTDLITVDGTAIQLDTTKRYLMLNKPVGVVSSLADDRGRPDLRQYTRNYEERVFNVGRGSTRRPAVCSFSPMTGISLTCSRIPRSASRRRTSPRCRAMSRVEH